LIDPGKPRLTIHSDRGVPILLIERDWELRPVAEEEKERLRERYRQSEWEEFRYWADRLPFPEVKTPFSTAVTDDLGRIWVGRFTGPFSYTEHESYVYDIFGSDGVWLGTQELVRRPQVIQSGHIYLTFEADSGGPRLERLRLDPLIEELLPGR
jgi:hypothetical protein